MAVEVLVCDILAAGIHDSETSAQVPESPADVLALPKFQAMLHPGKRRAVRRPVVAAELAHHATFAGVESPLVRGDRRLWRCAQPARSVARRKRPGGRRLGNTMDVVRPVMGNCHRRIASKRLSHGRYLVQLRNRGTRTVVSVHHDKARGVLLAYRVDELAAERQVVLPRRVTRRFVEEIEGEDFVGDALPSFRERRPQLAGRLLRHGTRAERERLRLVEDAVTGNPVERDLHVDAVLAPPPDRGVEVLHLLLAQIRPAVPRHEDAVVEGQPREVEAPVVQRLELPLDEMPVHARIGRKARRRAAEHAQYVEAAPPLGRTPVRHWFGGHAPFRHCGRADAGEKPFPGDAIWQINFACHIFHLGRVVYQTRPDCGSHRLGTLYPCFYEITSVSASRLNDFSHESVIWPCSL